MYVHGIVDNYRLVQLDDLTIKYKKGNNDETGRPKLKRKKVLN